MTRSNSPFKTFMITITDVTRMAGANVCVAGYSENGNCVRLTHYPHLDEHWLYFGNGTVFIRPFVNVRITAAPNECQAPHTEDWRIVPYRRSLKGQLTQNEQVELLRYTCSNDLSEMFGAPLYEHDGHWYVERGTGNRSLGTLGPVGVRQMLINEDEASGRWKARLCFTFQGAAYEMPVTDLAVWHCLNYHMRIKHQYTKARTAESLTSALQKPEAVYLRLGLARGSSIGATYINRCYVQVNGIFSFPDYLNGRCFADFAPPPTRN